MINSNDEFSNRLFHKQKIAAISRLIDSEAILTF